jgi:AcrR family transcriptional regulator
MTVTTRQRMIESAAAVMAERGLEGASFTEILERSGAARGAIYHHFPGGKFELAVEAIGAAGAAGRALIEATREQGDPVGAVRAFVALWRGNLEATDFRAGCPIVAVVADAPDDAPALLAAADGAFGLWHTALADGLVDAGIAAERARSLATLVISSIEGAVVLSRAKRSGEPLTQVGAELERTLREALPA